MEIEKSPYDRLMDKIDTILSEKAYEYVDPERRPAVVKRLRANMTTYLDSPETRVTKPLSQRVQNTLKEFGIPKKLARTLMVLITTEFSEMIVSVNEHLLGNETIQ